MPESRDYNDRDRDTDTDNAKDIHLSEILSVCSLLLAAGFLGWGLWVYSQGGSGGGLIALTGCMTVAWVALHNHAKIMRREQRHHEHAINLITLMREEMRELRTILTQDDVHADVLARLTRIERFLQREIDAFDRALGADEIAEHRRRSSR